MKFTLKWLKEYLKTEATLTEITDCLTKIGLEVEDINNRAESLKDFKVAQIKSVSKHPDADRLNICKVKTIDQEFQIVCGAPNVTEGMKVALAPLGSIIPANKMKIKKVKIRGVESIGMLCSEYELGLSGEHEGIIKISDEVEIGTAVATALNLDDPTIEIAITPNRGDCLGVYGIARDLAAAGIGELKPLNIVGITEKFSSKILIQHTSNDCRALNLLELKGVKNQLSPAWLKQRLKSIGIEPKSAVVDITNYTAYSFGQPLHAYDKDKIEQDTIEVINLEKETKFLGLNNAEYLLPKNSLVIKENKQILSLAGIIGGKSSSFNLETLNILLESGDFSEKSIINSGRKLNIETDSRYRFERKTDPLFTLKALNFAANLIQEICGAEASNYITTKKIQFSPQTITLDFNYLNTVAAEKLSISEIDNIFDRLGFRITEKTTSKITVEIPSWRNDITIDVDLIEEILRLRDFNKIPYIAFEGIKKTEENSLEIKQEFSFKKLLANLGLNEVITWSFYSDNDAKLFDLSDNLQIQNPISNDLSTMRASLIPNLVNIAKKEQNKGNYNCDIFEYGSIFNDISDIRQEEAIAAIRIGPKNIKEVNNISDDSDVFDIKEDVLTLCSLLNINIRNITFNKDNLQKYLHPERSTELFIGKNRLGYFGELHPGISKKLGLKKRLNLFEIYLHNIPKIKKKKKILESLDLQAVNRDFCFIVSDNIAAGDIKKEIYKTDVNLIKDVRIFDLYQGDKISPNKKSLAFNVVLQPYKESLTGDELELFNQKVINKISEKFNAVLPE